MNFAIQLLLNSLVTGTQVALIAVPLFLIFSVSKVYHFGIGAMGAFIAYLAYWMWVMTHSVPWVLGGFLLGTIFLTIASYLLLERFVRKDQTLLAFLVSFSLGVLLESGISILFGTDAKSFLETSLSTIRFGELFVTYPGMITIVVGLCFALATGFLLHGTSFGRLLRGTSEHPALVQSYGISVTPIRLITYALSIFLAGFVAVMIGLNSSLSPLMGNELNILGFVAFLLGGTRHLGGTIVASYLISILPQLIIGYTDLSLSWRLCLVFLLAMLSLLIFPQGFTSFHTRKA